MPLGLQDREIEHTKSWLAVSFQAEPFMLNRKTVLWALGIVLLLLAPKATPAANRELGWGNITLLDADGNPDK
jgi:hypothetical protein